jgi:hypothetical protein
VRRIGKIFLLAGNPLIAGDGAGIENANQCGPPIERRNFSEAEIQSTLQLLGITPASASSLPNLFTGSALPAQVQVHNPNWTSDVLTPFGIPFWACGLTSGPRILVVQNKLGQSASFCFTVQ